MRKTLLMAGSVLLCLILMFSLKSYSQALNWSSSYIPSWVDGNTNGNANNISGMSVNCTTTMSLSGGIFTNALGGSGAQTPTVSGATFTIPGSINRVQVTPNFTGNTNYCDIVMNFSAFITNISFRIVDIDKNNSSSTTYFDRVTITGSDGTNTYNAALSKYDAVTDPNFLVISGNTANVNTTSGQGGNTASDASDQRGTINVSFGTANLNRITIHYDNAAGANSNPAAQAIAIGNVSFSISPTLPTSLISFTGSQQGNDVLLKWRTIQEINTSSFILERNTGNNWQQVAAIAARGNSNQGVDYSYSDINPEKTVLLYRLKQVDADGNFKYSPVVRINNKNIKTELLVYPNPFQSLINLSIFSPYEQEVTARVSDATGKTIRSKMYFLSKGNNTFNITAPGNLQTGIYFIEIFDSGKRSLGVSRLIKD